MLTRLESQHEEFQARTLWSLSNAFTSAFKELEPNPQFRATAKLAGFLDSRFCLAKENTGQSGGIVP
jgi:hypothetical protein